MDSIAPNEALSWFQQPPAASEEVEHLILAVFEKIAASNPTGDLTFYLKGPTSFLGNFYPCKVTYNGLTFKCSEAAYQANKFTDPAIQKQFQNLDGADAWALAQKYTKEGLLRPDWSTSFKVQLMSEVVSAKFSQNPDLADKLLSTGDLDLREETN